MHIDAQTMTLVFTIVTGIGVLLQAAVLFGIFLGLRQTQKKLMGLTERLEDHIVPVVTRTRVLLEDVSPKVKVITSNLVDASGTLRAQAENVGQVVNDATSRTRHQTARVDHMITSTLNSIGYATAAVEKSVSGPLRQVSGVLAGLRAGLETLGGKSNAAGVKPVRPAASVATAGRVTHAAVSPIVEPISTPPAEVTAEEAREAAARFVRERATITATEGR